MKTHQGGDQITVKANLHGNDGNDLMDNTVDNTGDATGTGDATVATGSASIGGAAGGPGSPNFNLRVEQNKIPEFFGTKSKDTISAMDFIRQLDDLAKMN
jgi:hypothetical protein